MTLARALTVFGQRLLALNVIPPVSFSVVVTGEVLIMSSQAEIVTEKQSEAESATIQRASRFFMLWALRGFCVMVLTVEHNSAVSQGFNIPYYLLSWNGNDSFLLHGFFSSQFNSEPERNVRYFQC